MGGSSAALATSTNSSLNALNNQQALSQYVQGNPQASGILNSFINGSMDVNQAMQAIQGLNLGPSGAGALPTAPVAPTQPMLGGGIGAGAGGSGYGGLSPDQYQQAMQQYGQQMQQYQKQLSDYNAAQAAAPSNNGITNIGLEQALLSNPLTASKAAEQQALSSPTLSGIFNPGGQLSQAQGQYTSASNNLASDRNALMGNDQSYGLTDQDLAAYSQAAGNIARMFGNQENSLGASLAAHGLGAADSGVAQQGFSNIYGNQLEQLAGMQSQIAQNRIQTAMGLAQARTNADLSQQAQAQNYATNLSSLGQNAISNQYNRNIGSANQAYNQTANTAGINMSNQGLQQGVNNAQWQQQQSSGFNPMNIVSGLAGSITGGIGGNIGGATGQAITGYNPNTYTINYNSAGGNAPLGGK